MFTQSPFVLPASMRMRLLLSMAPAAFLFFIQAMGPQAQAQAQEVVKIGHVGPLTGPIAHLGKDNENGARLAIEELNAKGVVIGGKKCVLSS